MTRGSSLSDESVISEINENFVPYELNISNEGFPDINALKPWERAFHKDWKYSMAFATTVVVHPSGAYALGTTGSGHVYEYETAINYHPDRFLAFLKECKDRLARIQSIEQSTTATKLEKSKELSEIRNEILAQVSSVNRNKKWGGLRRFNR